MATPRTIFSLQAKVPGWLQMRRSGNTDPRWILNRQQVRTPPVPTEMIAAAIGVGLWTQPRAPWDAYLKADGQQANLWLSDRLSREDARWWTAHLLGHLLFDALPITQSVGADDPNYPESCARADAWAADLVAPGWLLRPVLYRGLPNAELSRMFGLEPGLMQALTQRFR